MEPELGDRGGGDLGHDRHGAVDVDADPVAEEIAPRTTAAARRCGDSPPAASRCRLTECGWIATYTSPATGSAVTTVPPLVDA